MSKHAFTIVVGVVIAISLLLYMFMFQVRSSEVAVLMTFEKPAEKLPGPGVHFQWPWPIQDVRKYDNRVQVDETRLEETATKDQYTIITSVCVGWQIADAKKFHNSFATAKEPSAQAWGKLDNIIRDKLSAVLGQHVLGDLISTERAKLQYDVVEEDARARADAEAQSTYGISVNLLKIQRLELPERVKQTVYQRMIADREREIQSISSEGQNTADVIKSQAKSTAEQLVSFANAEAAKLRGEGEAVAAGYYSVFKQNPDLAIYLRKVEALKEAVKKNTTIVADTNMPPFDLLQHGLDVKAAAPASGPAASSK